MGKIKIKQEIVDKPKTADRLYLIDDVAKTEDCDQYPEDSTEELEKQPKFRKKKGTGMLCDLCGMFRNNLKYLKLDAKHIHYDLIFMTAILRNLTSEDEISEFWKHGRCSICPNHFVEACETIFEMLGVQNPEEIQRAPMHLIDHVVQKMNSMHEVEVEMNESTFMKVALNFTMKHWPGNDKKRKRQSARMAEKRKAEEDDETLQDLSPEFAESSSDEIPADQLIKICKKELPHLIGLRKPKKAKLIKLEKVRAPKEKPKRKLKKCLLCRESFSIDTSIFGRIPREKLFLLLVAVENKKFTLGKANLEFNMDRWNVICREHLSSASKDILTIFGSTDSSEIFKASMDLVDELWKKAQKIQKNSELILIKSVEEFLEEAKNFVDLYGDVEL